MNVTILYPPISREERYGSSLGASGGKKIPLGIYYLAAVVRQHGHNVQVLEAEALNLTADDCLKTIVDFHPDFIGISSTTVAFHRALEIANNLARHYDTIPPPPPIVIGGPHASSNPEHALSFQCFAAAVIGEGEKTLIEMLRCMEQKADWHNIDGIAFMNEDKFVRTKSRDFIENLDEIPFPAYDLVPDMSVYTPPPHGYIKLPVAGVITSRGCPNQCTFCDQNTFGRKLRQRSPENIAGEIISLYEKYKIKEIAFADDTFTLNFDRVVKLFDILSKNNMTFVWSCNSRVNAVTRESIKEMKKLGCWRIAFGIESGDIDILKTIKKNIDLDQVRRVVSWCKEEKIETTGLFIVGHPNETLETIERTISFALSVPLSSIIVTINTPIPGSQQYREIDKYGTVSSTDWSQYNYWRPVFVPFGLSEEILSKKHKEFYRRFYFRLRIIWHFTLGFFKPGGLEKFFYLLKGIPYVFSKK